ncbi:MAG TPA: hypothetical protein VGM41_21900, partial [Chitinophagaceae bacterium]
MNRIVLCFVLSTTLYTTYGQAPAIETEQWDKKPVLHTLAAQYQKESAVILLDKRRIEYADEGKDVVAYKTLHKIVHINDDHGIEAFNRVYLGVTNNSDIIDIRAR